MTSKALIKQSQLSRMAKVAKEMGVMIEYVTEDGVIIRVVPAASNPAGTTSERQSYSHGRPDRNGKGRYPVIDDPNDPLRQWYDKLGFNPATMNEADMHRLQKLAHEKWTASMPGTPIGKREQAALQKLSQVGLGVRVLSSAIKGCGEDTLDRLEARGFIGRNQLLSAAKVKLGFSKEEIWLLESGWKSQMAMATPVHDTSTVGR